MGNSSHYKVIVIDTESTGVDPYSDEILQVSIIDGAGKVLFNKYIKPSHKESWPGAQRVNHISPKKVSKCKTIDKYLPKIQKIIDSADFIVGYNIKHFDIPILENAGIHFGGQEIVDVFVDVRGYFKKWPKLVDVALCTGYVFTPHDALEDCRATLHIFNKYYTVEVKKKAKEEGRSRDEQRSKVEEAKKVNKSGRLFELIFTITILFSGILLFYAFSNIGQNNLSAQYGEMRGLYIGIAVAGLYCYVAKGIIGPIVGTVGAALYFYKYGAKGPIISLSLQILVTLLALKLLFWLTKRQKNVLFRFILSSLAIFASMFMVYHLFGSYILSKQTSISLQEWRDFTLVNSIRSAFILEVCLPFYMVLDKIFGGLL